MHFGNWLNITPSFTFRSTYYGGQLNNGAFVDQGLFRNTEELSVDVRLPVFERVYDGGDTKWKHVIEPFFVYQFVNGVNDFGRFVRYDEDETLTDTNEIEYGITQRLYRRTGAGDTEEFITWRLDAEIFLRSHFRRRAGAGPAQRVSRRLDALTPFAFADVARNFSPIVSELTITPGKRFDTQFIVNYDPQRNRLTAIGTLLKLKPYKESFLTLAHFSTLNLPLNPSPPPANFEQHSNQLRALAGYGEPNRRGWNVMFGASYDFIAERLSKPDRGGFLQRLVLRNRLRIPPVFFRHDPQRESVQRRIPHRESRLRQETCGARKKSSRLDRMTAHSESELAFLSIEQAARLLRRREISPVDLVETSLARIERLNPSYYAFLTVLSDNARRQAKSAEREIRRGRARGPASRHSDFPQGQFLDARNPHYCRLEDPGGFCAGDG